jgi:hypothetical protein
MTDAGRPEPEPDGIASHRAADADREAVAERLRAGLLDAACRYAAAEGAEIVEAYPSPDGRSYRYMGTRELYRAAGFDDMPVPDGARPVVRRQLGRTRH